MGVLAIGECMAELSPLDQAGRFRLGFAGDTVNTAWYLARIAPDLDVSYFSAVGTDRISDDLRAFLRQSGINDSHIRRIDGQTIGLYLIQLNGAERSFCYWRGQSAAKQMLVDTDALDRAIQGAGLIYFSGITLAILDAGSRRTLFAALRKGREDGKVIAFDTNLRPALWSSPREMKQTVLQASALCDIVLPSFDDEADWFGDASPGATLNRYAQLGVERIIVKNSTQSVLYQDGHHRGEVAVQPATTIRDTTAAGDSFNAGVLAGLMAGKTMKASVIDGCTLARQVVGGHGALIEAAKLG